MDYQQQLMHLQNTQKEALGVTVSAVSMFGLIIIMVIKDMVQQQKHQLLNIIAGSIERIITFIKY